MKTGLTPIGDLHRWKRKKMLLFLNVDCKNLTGLTKKLQMLMCWLDCSWIKNCGFKSWET